ncbi:hypothetical protein BU17DRAFT_72643 [Hysterangium stoloniferum]|nr:hypothetical protein BU17DRAFT_72643 [Hysterangium stoloniferum]
MSLFSAFLPAPLILATHCSFWASKRELMMYLGIAATVKKELYALLHWLKLYSGVNLVNTAPNGSCGDNAGEGTRGEIKIHEPGTDGMFVDGAAHWIIEREKQEWRWSRACALWYTRIPGLKVQLSASESTPLFHHQTSGEPDLALCVAQ